MSVTVRYIPMRGWPGVATSVRKPRQVKAGFPRTLAQLRFELHKLEASAAVIAVDFPPSHFGEDGRLKISGARPGFPGVIIGIIRPAGRLRFFCDRFDSWKANLHAIAATLTALRKIDSNGTTESARLYMPWRVKVKPKPEARQEEHRQQAPPPRNAADIRTLEAATRFMETHSGIAANAILFHAAKAKEAHRRCAAKLHPDRGGNAADFIKLQEAWATVKARHDL